ncbi:MULTISPECIES: hypothetical protein [Cyanophyceae]|uniref:hypothetical protein n=1 Tax=Cyanophyceae TaxID=3028117 RepID=UPI001686217A|nr:hypothetical protein [Trichocoleus sp. FACHB-40]MBD2005598.1 hypothetical protein [Trichocoleus sp. FACHB-40]
MNTEQKSLLTTLGIGAAVTLFLFSIGFGAGWFTSPNSTSYKDEKIKRENLEQVVLKLTAENERLKADLQGGRTASEEQLSLEKRGQELARREQLLDKRENDLESRVQDFNSTVRTTGEEVGQASQIQKDYEDTKQLLREVTNSRNTWQISSVILLVVSLIAGLFIFDYIRKLRYSKWSLEKVIEVLRGKFNNPSVSVEEVKSVVDAFTQLSAQTSKALPPSNKPEEAAT